MNGGKEKIVLGSFWGQNLRFLRLYSKTKEKNGKT
jgi:hypothetical protein